MDYGQIIYRTADDSYVITKDGMPYHVYPYAAEFAGEWDAVFAYAEAHPECVTEEQPYVPTLEDIKQDKKSLIDAETSAAILAGFNYVVNGATYHFSYALDDQQNFSDTANVCLMKQAGMPGLPDSVTWNAYTPDGELAQPDVRCAGLPRALRGRGHEAQERDDAARRGTQGGGGGRDHAGRG